MDTFNDIGSFMGHLEDIPSPFFRSTSSNPMKFSCANDIENAIHVSDIIVTSFILTFISFQFELDNIFHFIFFMPHIRWRLTKFKDVQNFFVLHFEKMLNSHFPM